MFDNFVREMYLVHDTLFDDEERAKLVHEGKPHIVHRVFVGCEEKDRYKTELDPYEYIGLIDTDIEKLKVKLEKYNK